MTRIDNRFDVEALNGRVKVKSSFGWFWRRSREHNHQLVADGPHEFPIVTNVGGPPFQGIPFALFPHLDAYAFSVPQESLMVLRCPSCRKFGIHPNFVRTGEPGGFTNAEANCCCSSGDRDFMMARNLKL